MDLFQNTEIAFQYKSHKQLKKAYYLFRLIENPYFTKLGNAVIRILIKYRFPFIKSIVKSTLYEQFCGGEDLDTSTTKVKKIHQYGVQCVLDYSVEGKMNEASFENTYQEIIRNIDWAIQREEIPFVVFKPTGIGNIEIYEKIGKKEILNREEKKSWELTLDRFDSIAKKAKEAGISILIDAEESWIQDAADWVIEDLMKKYNTHKAIVVNTLQMYRHDRLNYLKREYEKAKEGNYKLGFKIVRGAYMEKERNRAENLKYPSPIHATKFDTDKDYDLAIEFCILHHQFISVYVGTHNELSTEKAIALMKKLSLPNDFHKIWFGQLYGMSDNLTYNLGNLHYNATKYLPYGPVKEVVPYLIRRAEENTSISGQTSRELSLITKELERRKSIGNSK